MQRKKNVLYITYLGLLEPIPKAQVLPYLVELSKTINIHLLSFEKRKWVRVGQDDIKYLESHLKQNNITWHRLPYHKYPKVLSSIADIGMGIVYSMILIIRYRIGIIHARANVPVAMGVVLKSLFPIKLIYDRRGLMGEEHVENSGWRRGGWLYRFSQWFERKVFSRSDGIVVLTDRVKENLREENMISSAKAIQTIPCCVDLALFKRTSKNSRDRFTFVYSGTMGTYNLLHEMFDFFRCALKKIPNAHFLILTREEKVVRDFLLNDTSLTVEQVTVRSAKREEMADQLSQADVGLMFRQDSPTAIAASPTKMAEYLACGLPIVALESIGDCKRIIEDNQVGVSVKGYRDTEYQRALDELQHLFQNKEELRQRCRQVAEQLFPLHHGVAQYRDLYHRI